MSLSKPTKRATQTARDLIANDDEVIMLNCYIPKSLHKRLKLKAVELDTTMTELVRAGIEDVLSRK